MKDYYDSRTADCHQSSTGNCSLYRQYNRRCSHDTPPSCKYPLVYGNFGNISNMAPPEVLSQAATNTGSYMDVYRTSDDFRSSYSKLVQGQTLPPSTAVEIYPWMKETRQNNKRQNLPTAGQCNTLHIVHCICCTSYKVHVNISMNVKWILMYLGQITSKNFVNPNQNFNTLF